MNERRSQSQLILSIASILSVILASVSLISFVQVAERRLTTMEVRLENLAEMIKNK